MEHKIRPSALEYAKICKNNGFVLKQKSVDQLKEILVF